ncbi:MULTISPECIES: hypothetical protein [unclassified Nocardioides]|uniref:hypothetical protein n=1 Tax=unclassified Nocardioides TaxID=2615069 RepID=UPI003014AFE2
MTDLEAALARAAAVSERAAAVTRTQPVDPAVRAALDEVSGAASASAAEQSVGERVRCGLLGWDDVWRDPHTLGPAAVRLVQRALVVVAQDIGRAAG